MSQEVVRTLPVFYRIIIVFSFISNLTSVVISIIFNTWDISAYFGNDPVNLFCFIEGFEKKNSTLYQRDNFRITPSISSLAKVNRSSRHKVYNLVFTSRTVISFPCNSACFPGVNTTFSPFTLSFTSTRPSTNVA